MSQLSLFKGLVGRVSVLLVFAVGAVGLFLMMGGLGEGQEVMTNDPEEIEYPENGTGTVVAYIGDGPGGAVTVTWSSGRGRMRGISRLTVGVLTFITRRILRVRGDADTATMYMR